jgi:rare lipoprotein A (peptidoglycan hydrolase)
MDMAQQMQSTNTISRYRLGTLAIVAAGALMQGGCSLVSGPVAPASDGDASVALAPAVNNSSMPKAALQPVGLGKASWYGPGFRGKKTASGEIFDDSKFTAAHKYLPLGSKAKVTNLNNGKSVKVEINDRGPFAQDRIIDLSRAAAHALGMVDRGVANVRVDLVRDESGAGVDSVD